jgi:HAD superfamily hydrolase (TIGR01509 family)
LTTPNKQKIKVIIFDFDGVIADTDKSRFLILSDLLRRIGIRMTNSDFNKMVGKSTRSFLSQNFSSLTNKTINAITKERHKIYFSDLPRYCIPNNKMRETIACLSQKFRLAIVTTNSSSNLQRQLEFLHIEDYFQWKVGREIVEDSEFKKDYSRVPTIFGEAVENCIVIEDSEEGIKAAKKAGYYVIAFSPLNNIHSTADNVVYSFDELLELVNINFN